LKGEKKSYVMNYAKEKQQQQQLQDSLDDLLSFLHLTFAFTVESHKVFRFSFLSA